MIHATVISESRIPGDADIGAYAVIGEDVSIGNNVRIASHAVVHGPCTLSDGVSIGPSAVIGTDPQDLKYGGERSELIIGKDTVIREFANINRGTGEGGRTVVGENCLIMAYVHIAHDCIIGDEVILANAVNLAGHVEVNSHVTIGGVVPIHQFVRIGQCAMVGGGYRVNKDIPPFVIVGGYPLRVRSLNKIKLKRNEFSSERIKELYEIFRYLFRHKGLLTEKATEIIRNSGNEDGLEIAEFILSSKRGVVS